VCLASRFYAELSDEDDETGELRWKENIAKNVKMLHSLKVAYRAADLARLLYDEELTAVEVVARWRGDNAMTPIVAWILLTLAV
jgi:ribosome biogenesis protein BMS1